jgi:hypothetical protein
MSNSRSADQVGLVDQHVVETQRHAVKGNDNVLQITDKYIKDIMPLLDLAGGSTKTAVLTKATSIKQTWYAQVGDSAQANIAYGRGANNIIDSDNGGQKLIQGSGGS